MPLWDNPVLSTYFLNIARAATSLLNAGMHIEVLRDLLGHHSLEQTRRYANLTDKTRKAQYFATMATIEGSKNK